MLDVSKQISGPDVAYDKIDWLVYSKNSVARTRSVVKLKVIKLKIRPFCSRKSCFVWLYRQRVIGRRVVKLASKQLYGQFSGNVQNSGENLSSQQTKQGPILSRGSAKTTPRDLEPG